MSEAVKTSYMGPFTEEEFSTIVVALRVFQLWLEGGKMTMDYSDYAPIIDDPEELETFIRDKVNVGVEEEIDAVAADDAKLLAVDVTRCPSCDADLTAPYSVRCTLLDAEAAKKSQPFLTRLDELGNALDVNEKPYRGDAYAFSCKNCLSRIDQEEGA